MAARNPPPESPVRTYPSPNIADQVLIEFVTSELANKKPLAPGTAHENTREFAGYKLGIQKVNPADHNWFMRLWVTNETSPDAWNYAIKYVSESVAHPIYIRSYREPKANWRATYGRARGSADPDFGSGAKLVSEEALQFPQDSEFFALYFQVMRVYQTLPGPVLNEQTYDDTDDIVLQRTRQTVAAGSAGIGTNRREIKAIDSVQSEITDADISAFATFAASYKLVFTRSTNIQFPDVLTGIDAFVETQSGAGDDTDGLDASGSITNSGSWTLSPRSSSNSSVVAMPDITPVIEQKYGANKPVTDYIFLLPSPVTAAVVLTKLAALIGAPISAWPKFNPRNETIFCVGGRATVQAKATAYYHFGTNSCGTCGSSEFSANHGNGASYEIGVTIKAVRIPATIHGAIDVTGFGSQVFSITADAAADAFLSSDSRSASADIAAYVSPLSLTATTGATTIPSSGYFLLDTDAAPYRFGYIKLRCTVLNGADL